VGENESSAARTCSGVRQFLINSTFVRYEVVLCMLYKYYRERFGFKLSGEELEQKKGIF